MTTTTTENGSNSAYIGSSYSGLPNELVKAANGVDYVYRDSGPTAGEGVPLVLLQHFRGNLDNWDPALIDALASARRVITFDNAGVGGSTGSDTEHRGGDGTRRDRLHGRHGPRPG